MVKKKKKDKKGKKGLPSASRLTVVKEKKRLNLESHEWYKAEFLNVEIKKGKYGPYARWSFKILNGVLEDGETDAEGTLTSALCDAELALGSEMLAFCSSVMGQELELNDDIDITPYYGDTFEVNCVTTKKNDEGKAHSNVVKIRKLRKKKKTSSKKSSKKKSSKKKSKK